MTDQTLPVSTPPVLNDGMTSIALSFSGGGFRAACFTLGCTDYLNEVIYEGEPLLKKVTFISSASGGSITNLVLSSMLRQGFDFKAIHNHLVKQLSGTVLMDAVFKVLNNTDAWVKRPEKSRNLINAFAMVYDQLLFNEAAFEVLSQPAGPDQMVIKETCVNTTEFTNGLNFRWDNGTGMVGNKYLSFSDGLAGAAKVRLGDILASSSCFPGGFEPIMFPVDFANPEAPADILRQGIRQLNNFTSVQTDFLNQHKDVNFGFMDGGIDDNQGIYAFMLADGRQDKPFDLYFPCDVSSNYLNDPFTYPKPVTGADYDRTGTDFIKDLASKIRWYFIICLVLLAAGTAGAITDFRRSVSLALTGGALVGLLLPLLSALLLKKWLKNLLSTLFPSAGDSGSWGKIFDKYKAELLKLSLGQMLTMLLARATSVLLLADTVYLKRIRQLSYNNLYASKNSSLYKQLITTNNAQTPPCIIDTTSWNGHTAQTTVYKLAAKNDAQLRSDLKGDGLDKIPVSDSDPRTVFEILYPIPAILQAHADTATNMDTTLWFDEDQQKNGSLESLLITGQATMCFNLIRTAYRFGNTEKSWIDLRETLILHWEKFKNTPDWLCGELNNNTGRRE